MRRACSWIFLNSVGAGALLVDRVRNGASLMLKPADMKKLPWSLCDLLREDSFDLTRQIAVSRNAELIDWSLLEQ